MNRWLETGKGVDLRVVHSVGVSHIEDELLASLPPLPEEWMAGHRPRQIPQYPIVRRALRSFACQIKSSQVYSVTDGFELSGAAELCAHSRVRIESILYRSVVKLSRALRAPSHQNQDNSAPSSGQISPGIRQILNDFVPQSGRNSPRIRGDARTRPAGKRTRDPPQIASAKLCPCVGG